MKLPKQINNINERVVDDLKERLSSHSRVSIAADYLYNELAEKIKGLDDFELITFLVIRSEE